MSISQTTQMLYLIEVLAGIRDELHAISEKMETKEIDGTELIDAVNKITKETGKCPLIL